MYHNMVNLGLLTADISSRVWGTPANFNGFRVLASLLQRRLWNYTELSQTAPPILGWAAMNWASAHILVVVKMVCVLWSCAVLKWI